MTVAFRPSRVPAKVPTVSRASGKLKPSLQFPELYDSSYLWISALEGNKYALNKCVTERLGKVFTKRSTIPDSLERMCLPN